MSEPENQTLELLKRIQRDLTETKTLTEDNTRMLQDAIRERDALQRYITHAVGLSAQSAADIDHLQEQITALNLRLEALESA